MDAQQVLAQGTAVATALVATAVPTTTTAPATPTPSLFPAEVGYIITAILGALAAYLVNRITYGWQRRDQFKLEEGRAQREADAEAGRARREEEAEEERRYREWRREIEHRQEEIQRDFDQRLNAINLAILRLERTVHEIEGYIDPIRDAVRLSIRRKLQDDVPGP